MSGARRTDWRASNRLAPLLRSTFRDTDRPRMTFDLVLTQVREFKQLSKQPSCTWRNENLIWFCDLLQP